MRILSALISLMVALCGCAGPKVTGAAPTVTGNELGGVMHSFRTNEQQGLEKAQAHCAQYGRTARITSIHAQADGSVSFECS
jgi:hypothetical protein